MDPIPNPSLWSFTFHSGMVEVYGDWRGSYSTPNEADHRKDGRGLPSRQLQNLGQRVLLCDALSPSLFCDDSPNHMDPVLPRQQDVIPTIHEDINTCHPCAWWIHLV